MYLKSFKNFESVDNKIFESAKITIDEILYFFYAVIDDHNFHKIDFKEEGYDDELFDNHNYFASIDFDKYVLFDFICVDDDIINKIIRSSKIVDKYYFVSEIGGSANFESPEGATKPHISIKISPKIIKESVDSDIDNDIDYHTQIIKDAFTDVIDEYDIYPWFDGALSMNGIFYKIREQSPMIIPYSIIKLIVSFFNDKYQNENTKYIRSFDLGNEMDIFRKRLESMGYELKKDKV